MSEVRPEGAAPGPFDVTQVRSGDRYELSRGHPIYVAPTGGAGARGTVLGAEVLETDPAVETAGIDAGYALAANTLRAPDVAVGNGASARVLEKLGFVREGTLREDRPVGNVFVDHWRYGLLAREFR